MYTNKATKNTKTTFIVGQLINEFWLLVSPGSFSEPVALSC